LIACEIRALYLVWVSEHFFELIQLSLVDLHVYSTASSPIVRVKSAGVTPFLVVSFITKITKIVAGMGRKYFNEQPEPHSMNGLNVPTDDDTRERVRDALRSADDHNETEFLDALLKVIEYERDETFDTSELI